MSAWSFRHDFRNRMMHGLWALLQEVCAGKRSYKYVSDFVRLRSYGRLKLRVEGKDF